MREYLKKLKPTSLNDLSAMNALYRPGPMEFIDDFIDRKFGVKEVKYLHNVLEPILKETYGVIVYQEQVIQIANKVGGMSLADADILRRAMGKKDLLAMAQQKSIFVEGAEKNTIPKKIAEEIFDAIDKFANYGFNKSHSVAYSYLAYQTAYLKAYYTPEFLAANLTNEFGNKNKVSNFLEDCRKLKIEVLPPDVNHPTVSFDVVNGKIRFGMSAIKNVGINAVEEIIRTRNKIERNFTSIFDFCANVDSRIVNKRTLEGLVVAGAFDNINKNRASLFESVEVALEFGHKAAHYQSSSENSLFEIISEEMKISEPNLPDVKPWSEKEKLAKEREVIGFYVTGHPLKKYQVEYRSFATVHLGETEEMENVDSVRACGVITKVETKIDKAGKLMAFLTLDDFSGSCEALVFSKTYDKIGKFLSEEECVFIIGKPESSGDAIKIQIEDVVPLLEARERFTESIKISLDEDDQSMEKVNRLKIVFEKYQGNIPIFLNLVGKGSKPKLFFLKNFRAKISNEFVEETNQLLGEDSVIFTGKR